MTRKEFLLGSFGLALTACSRQENDDNSSVVDLSSEQDIVSQFRTIAKYRTSQTVNLSLLDEKTISFSKTYGHRNLGIAKQDLTIIGVEILGGPGKSIKANFSMNTHAERSDTDDLDILLFESSALNSYVAALSSINKNGQREISPQYVKDIASIVLNLPPNTTWNTTEGRGTLEDRSSFRVTIEEGASLKIAFALPDDLPKS